MFLQTPNNFPSSTGSGFKRPSVMAKINGKVAGRRALPLAVSVLLKRQRPGLALREWGEESKSKKLDVC